MHPLRFLALLILPGLFLAFLGLGASRAAFDPAAVPTPTPIPTPLAPALLGPEDGADVTGISDPPLGLPLLNWAPVDGVHKYHIQLATSAGFASPLVDADTAATAYAPDTALADGVYYWRVKAQRVAFWGPYSEERSFVKDWSAAGALTPQLLSPPPGARRAAFEHEDFQWTPLPGAASYLLELSTDPAFSTLAYSAVTLVPHHTPTLRLARNTYYWRVTPIDRREHYGAASASQSFDYDWNLAPQLLSPAPDAVHAFAPPFEWTAIEGAKEYRLEVSTQPDFSAVAIYRTRNTALTPAKTLSNDQDYYWRVQATDARNHNSPWSESRRFRLAWDFRPQLLTPANNSILLAHPFFSWTPIPGAERYQIQIDESTAFSSPVANISLYNVTTYAHGDWRNLTLDRDYFWRVRGVDAQSNYGPWSAVSAFRVSTETSPNPIYPLYYYPPDSANLPVHSDRSIAWPLFLWDTAHIFTGVPAFTQPPDFYELTVDDNPLFLSPNFSVQTAGLGAAPTLATPFTGLSDGKLFYWRLRAVRAGRQMGADVVWLTRYDSQATPLPFALTPTPIYPADGFEAVASPPALGWLPVSGAGQYRLQISRDRDFNDVVEDVQPQFVNYVPWQGQLTPMPCGSYWWRVRAEAPAGEWSAPRHFNLSLPLVTGNKYDVVPPTAPRTILDSAPAYDPASTYVAASPDQGLGAYELGALHIMQDRVIDPNTNYNWVIAFETGAGPADDLWYGVYVDTDHVDNAGAAVDPLGKPIVVDSLFLPDYVLYIHRQAGDVLDPSQAFFFEWDGAAWRAPRTLAAMGGLLWRDPARNAVQALVPYTALGAADADFSGSIAVALFSTSGAETDGMRDSVPPQGAVLARPASLSNMLMPLYPFDTPFSNPIVHFDVPPMRWRMPQVDSIDGYQVEIARDARFTDIIETWDTIENQTSGYFGLAPTIFQPTRAYTDNESYYWRVRVRHERYVFLPTDFFDYGPWSPPMRFKLDSRRAANLRLSTGAFAQMTPSFQWDRVEGASGYSIQIDDDASFSSPTINQKIDLNSFTPQGGMESILADGSYFWRVAMRRSNTVSGYWTEGPPFVVSSVTPLPLSPIADAEISQQPTFAWTAVLTPTLTPRVAAGRYQLQLDDDPNFSTPTQFETDNTSFTLPKGRSIADGTWYWRVAVLHDFNKTGPFSPVQRFYKEYLAPTLIAPAQGATSAGLPVFTWAPLSGAAYYRIEIATNEQFRPSQFYLTDNTRFTPQVDLKAGGYYWRVQMFDRDRISGPWEMGRVTIGPITDQLYLPVQLAGWGED